MRDFSIVVQIQLIIESLPKSSNYKKHMCKINISII